MGLGLWVPTRPPRHCGRVGTHHGGVRSDFRCLQSHLKKKNGKIQFFFWPKMRKKTQKKKIVSGPLGNVKTYLDTKFQLIWPSNEARASRNHFFGNFKSFFYFFFAFLRPNELKFGVKIGFYK